jgi:hypothetical protein
MAEFALLSALLALMSELLSSLMGHVCAMFRYTASISDCAILRSNRLLPKCRYLGITLFKNVRIHGHASTDFVAG